MAEVQRTPEQILEEARKLIGSESQPSYGRYAVEYEPIRRYAWMTSDDNPLFLDPEYAGKTKHGGVICPPLFVGNFAGPGPWPPVRDTGGGLPPVPAPGDRAINLTTEHEFLKPVKIGDRLSSTSRIADVYIKAIRLDPKAFWTVNERIIKNQNGEVVYIGRNIGLRHRSPEAVRAAGDA